MTLLRALFLVALLIFGQAHAAATFGAVGTAATGTTSVAPTYPTGISASTSRLFMIVTGRSSDESADVSAVTGWTHRGTIVGGTGTYGAGTGTRRITILTKDTVTGSESGTVTVSWASGDGTSTMHANIVRVEVTSGYNLTLSFASGADTSQDTSWSATMSPSQTFAVDQLGIIVFAVDAPVGVGSIGIAATGITFAAQTSMWTTNVTNGNDHRSIARYTTITAGSGSQAATITGTPSSAGAGPNVLLLLADEPAPAGGATKQLTTTGAG
jgi:hypothetical protein